MYKVIDAGKRKRRSYARIDEVLELPDLIEVQKKSYKWFLEKGLQEMFDEISPVQDFTETWFWSSSIIHWGNLNIP